MEPSHLHISLEFTPNPNTLKYAVNRQLLPRGAVNFTQPEEARKKSPLAARLFSIDGICGVMIGVDFVTVTKTETGDWDQVHRGALEQLHSHFNSGEPLLAADLPAGAASTDGAQPQSEIEQKICDFLEKEIRPAVAMDGGDITFERFDQGVVYLQMQGSCSGCPSSTATLKVGIEQRLQQLFPEIKEVVAV